MEITTPISEEVVRSLHVGQIVEITGSLFTGRDSVHRYLFDGGKCPIDMTGSVIYHCGPVVVKENGATDGRNSHGPVLNSKLGDDLGQVLVDQTVPAAGAVVGGSAFEPLSVRVSVKVPVESGGSGCHEGTS